MTGKLTKDDVRGIIPPLVTPFTENEDLDLESFEREVRYLLDLGAKGFVVGGSTGEGHALSPTELGTLCDLAVKAIAGRVPVIGGIITTYTRDAIERAKQCREAGVAALMMTPPIYQVASIAGMVDYYTSVWKATDLPIIIYNVLPRTPVTPQATKRLAEIPGIIGTKESIGGNLETLGEIIEEVGDKISVTWAQDPLMLPGYAMGATGSISGINTVLPEHSIRMFDAIQKNDLETAVKLHFQMTPVARAIGMVNWPAGIKASINLQGRKVGPARRPFGPLSPEHEARIKETLAQAGAIPAGVA